MIVSDEFRKQNVTSAIKENKKNDDININTNTKAWIKVGKEDKHSIVISKRKCKIKI